MWLNRLWFPRTKHWPKSSNWKREQATRGCSSVVEQRAVNSKVVGSIPSSPANGLIVDGLSRNPDKIENQVRVLVSLLKL